MTEARVKVQVAERIGVLWQDRYWEASDGVFEMDRSAAEGYARNGSVKIVEDISAPAAQPSNTPRKTVAIGVYTDKRSAAFLAKAGYETVDDLVGVDLDTLLNVKYLSKAVAKNLHARFANRSAD